MAIIRELQPGDNLDEVLTLCKDFFAEYENHHGEFFDTDNLGDADIIGRFQQSPESDNSATIIAIVDDRIVGYALLVIREQSRFYRVKKVGAISGLMVAPDFRRQGIAAGLLEASKVYLRQHGLKYYTLYTSVANEGASRFYEDMGLTALQTVFLGETGISGDL